MTATTAVSLFAGIEGIGLALEQAGVRVVASVEIDDDCRSVLARHFPATRLFSDVTEVTSAQLIAAGFVPGEGIITAGFPCQDLSIAGRRAGLGGARSGLFWHVVRLADELRPRWLLLENVPGLLSAVCSCPGDDACTANGRAVRCGEWRTRAVAGSADPGPHCPACEHDWGYHDDDGYCTICDATCDIGPAPATERYFEPNVAHAIRGGACRGGCMPAHGGAMGTVLGALGKLGYGFAWRVLDAQFFGVPQRRSRVFIVGCLGDRAAPVEVLLEPEGSQGHPAARRAPGKGASARAPGGAGDTRTVGTIGGSGPGGGWRVGSDEAAAGQLVTAPTITAGWGTNHGAPGHGGKDGPVLATMAATLQGGGRRGHRIDAEGAAGGHLIPFDTAQITSAENRANPQPGDPSPTLNAKGLVHVAPLALSVGAEDAAYAVTSRASRASREETYILADTSAAITAHHGKGPDSDATNGLILAHALTSEGADASEDGTGAYGTSGVPRPVPSSLAVAGDFSTGEGVAQAVRSAHGQPGCVTAGLAVRRLTPLETERLQGLPDNWTRWKLADGQLVEQSDSARYRQVGNSVAVPCVAWITRRIAAYDQAAAGREAS